MLWPLNITEYWNSFSIERFSLFSWGRVQNSPPLKKQNKTKMFICEPTPKKIKNNKVSDLIGQFFNCLFSVETQQLTTFSIWCHIQHNCPCSLKKKCWDIFHNYDVASPDWQAGSFYITTYRFLLQYFWSTNFATMRQTSCKFFFHMTIMRKKFP